MILENTLYAVYLYLICLLIGRCLIRHGTSCYLRVLHTNWSGCFMSRLLLAGNTHTHYTHAEMMGWVHDCGEYVY